MNARIFIGSLVLAIFAALLAGCEPAGPVTTKGVLTRTAVNPPLPPPPPGAATPEVVRNTNPFDRAGATPAEAAATTPADTPPAADPTYSPAGPTDSSPKPSIRLSVGIALPQTLPDGTQIGVGVDYKVTSGRLSTSAKYFWVIEKGQGEVAMEVQLKPQGGNLAGFLPISIRPEDGPFKTRIDEVSTSGSRATVSNVESLR